MIRASPVINDFILVDNSRWNFEIANSSRQLNLPETVIKVYRIQYLLKWHRFQSREKLNCCTMWPIKFTCSLLSLRFLPITTLCITQTNAVFNVCARMDPRKKTKARHNRNRDVRHIFLRREEIREKKWSTRWSSKGTGLLVRLTASHNSGKLLL